MKIASSQREARVIEGSSYRKSTVLIKKINNNNNNNNNNNSNNNNNNSNNDIIRWTSEKVSANGGPLNSGLVRFTVIH